MSTVNLRLARNTLFRAFVISAGFTLLTYVTTFPLWSVWSSLICDWFHMPAEQVGPVMLGFFCQIKFFNVYLLLVPALALHWTIKTQEKSN